MLRRFLINSLKFSIPFFVSFNLRMQIYAHFVLLENISPIKKRLYCPIAIIATFEKKPAAFFSKPAVFDFKARRVFFKARRLFFQSSHCFFPLVKQLF
ncbi:hypothetical protein HMPREF1981_01512 [Bacteroides pyogenes F0041]|uniref:Uncharacterized protein n=1 Tax=Bacteroides pyogenes F0041 TaxID=1321819 RepID=U2DVH6_9BACE|nr:hypothetical protein HMPREF1981_01512 [Bacteroides pyogenes F0041]GAE23602.1 hypothetical protein JCM10003_3398 [Bacteroides pyogenes JCM 10003]